MTNMRYRKVVICFIAWFLIPNTFS